MTGYSDSYSDLLNFSLGVSSYLRDSDGQYETYDYYSSTTATSSTPGGVANYLEQSNLRLGELGTAIPQELTQYVTRTNSGGITLYPVASLTHYRNTNGTGGQTTSFAYTWVSGGFGIQSVTTTYPTVTTGQNGSGTAATETAYFDALGNPTWFKDPGGYLQYQAFDVATGAIDETITDVDSTRTSDFSGLPSGWSTPSGGGLHLKSTATVDALGRPTLITDPNGNLTYIVYNDPNHETRYYRGWNSSTGLPTGPTEVDRDDLTHGYSETLTMSATPAISGGVPTGTESVSNVQSLSRTYWDAGGDITNIDDYFNLSGLTYSTSTSLGTLGTNFYRTVLGYNNRDILDRIVSPQGTIDRTVYDGQGRPISEWIGTDDTPTSGTWSPSNTAGTNLVQVRAYEYDGGGVGDGNLTKETDSPGGGAADRVTQYYYDWRDREVAVKEGVQTTEIHGGPTGPSSTSITTISTT